MLFSQNDIFDNLNAKTYPISGEFDPAKTRTSKAKAEAEFDAEVEKLGNWSVDRKTALEVKLREINKKI